MSGPYETEREAMRAAADAHGVNVPGGRASTALLLAAIEFAGVELGAYDRRIVDWLAGYEPQMCAVVAGLITRAHAAGQTGPGGPGTAQPGGGWISGPST